MIKGLCYNEFSSQKMKIKNGYLWKSNFQEHTNECKVIVKGRGIPRKKLCKLDHVAAALQGNPYWKHCQRHNGPRV